MTRVPVRISRAELPGRSRERVGGGVRVDGAVVGDPDRAVEGLLRRRRHEAQGLVRPDELDVEPDRARPARPALELLQALGAGRDPQAPDGLEDAELAVELDAVAAKAHHGAARG